jgi:hypothetical protein
MYFTGLKNYKNDTTLIKINKEQLGFLKTKTSVSSGNGGCIYMRVKLVF